jgi:hypothetical protein
VPDTSRREGSPRVIFSSKPTRLKKAQNPIGFPHGLVDQDGAGTMDFDVRKLILDRRHAGMEE